MRYCVLACLLTSPSWAGWPLAPDASVADYADAGNWPQDPDYARQWNLWSFTPPSLAARLSPAEQALGIGSSVDSAWSVTRGDPHTLVAVASSGVLWGERDLVNRWYLNRGELPPPQNADGGLAPGPDPYDRNGDGRFNVQDYTSAVGTALPTPDLVVDPRLLARADHGDVNGNGVIDPQDLIALFSNGVDDDHNGYVDDIAGWDFFWNDNDAADDLLNGGMGQSAGTRLALGVAAQANNGIGGVGVCPECTVLPLRTGDSVSAEPNRAALAVLYAADARAQVLALGVQTRGFNPFLQTAIDRARAQGTLTVAAGAPASSLRHDFPSNLERVVFPRALGPDTDLTTAKTFLDTRCGSRGPHVTFAAPTDQCGDGALALTAGLAGLALSAARTLNIVPPLTPGELEQVLARTTQALPPGNAWTGGSGRLDARRTLDAVEAGQLPAAVEVVTPAWFAVLSPVTPFSVSAHVVSRGPFDATLEGAFGVPTVDADFTRVATASGSGDWSGALGPVRAAALKLLPPNAPFADVLTVRLTVTTHYPDARGDVVSRIEKSFFVLLDADAVPGFPLYLGASPGGSPRFVDLKGDGSEEVVVGTADGRIHAFGYGGLELPGFPLALPPDRDLADHSGAPSFSSGAVDAGASSPVVGLAFAPISDSGTPDIIAATARGELHVLGAGGAELAGFPYTLDNNGTLPCDLTTVSGCTRSGTLLTDAGVRVREVERGFFAAPVVTSSGGRPLIVQAGLDGFLHAVGADGLAAFGFPFEVTDSRGFDGGLRMRARLMGTPAVADLDGDAVPEAVMGSGETDGLSGRGYVVHLSNPPSLASGWPLALQGLTAQAPFYGRGAPASPVIADLDGSGARRFALRALGGPLTVFGLAGNDALDLDDSLTGQQVTQPSTADLTGAGILQLADAVQADGGEAIDLWAAGLQLQANATVSPRPAPSAQGFPVALPDDVSGTGFAVVSVGGGAPAHLVSGSAAGIVNALDQNGMTPNAWPKLTGGPVDTTPAVGVMANRVVVAVVTQDGWLFAWNTLGPPSSIQWDGFHHDPANTGFAGTPLPPRHISGIGITHPPPPHKGCCSGAPTAAELWGLPLLLCLLRRRR